MHCNVKPENMLLCEGRRLLKLCGFGHAEQCDSRERTSVGVLKYFKHEAPHGSHDVYSWALCLYHTLSNKTPSYEGVSLASFAFK